MKVILFSAIEFSSDCVYHSSAYAVGRVFVRACNVDAIRVSRSYWVLGLRVASENRYLHIIIWGLDGHTDRESCPRGGCWDLEIFSSVIVCIHVTEMVTRVLASYMQCCCVFLLQVAASWKISQCFQKYLTSFTFSICVQYFQCEPDISANGHRM